MARTQCAYVEVVGPSICDFRYHLLVRTLTSHIMYTRKWSVLMAWAREAGMLRWRGKPLELSLAPSRPSVFVSILISIILGLKLSDRTLAWHTSNILLPRLRKSDAVETDMCYRLQTGSTPYPWCEETRRIRCSKRVKIFMNRHKD